MPGTDATGTEHHGGLVTDTPKVDHLTANEITAAANEKGIGDALSDPLSDVAKEIVDEVADLAKERLRKIYGLPPDEPKPLPPLPRNSILRQAKSVEELGLDESTITARTLKMDAKVKKR